MKSDLYMSYKVIESNEGQAVKTIPSYEVAEMMETKHSKVIRMIEGDEDRVGIIPTLRKAQMGVSKYFIESTYKVEGNNKTYKCYECTKLGCDMLANKMTGEKGILFTAKYVERFNEMVENPLSNMSKELQAIFMLDRKQQDLEEKVNYIEDKMTVNYELAENLRSAINVRAVEILGGKNSRAYKVLNRRLYSAFHKDIKKYFKVNSYKNLSVKNYDEAISYIEKWHADELLVYAIQGVNSQITFNEEVVTNE